ncbi:MAG: phytanoyl-CoA dioxygenase family protein [Planctomycetes bacterium]|nr:phytanoyl-CoA dioxygenase family protein [Planctomycetota bacterium]
MARTSNALSRAISRAKGWVQRNPALYSLAYRLTTSHLQGIGQALQRSRYHSRFGGTWIDRRDFARRLAAKQRRGEVSESEATELERFERDGFLVYERAVDPALIDRLLGEIDRERAVDAPRLMVDDAGGGPRAYTPDALRPTSGTRIVDFHFLSETARAALFSNRVTRFLETLFERDPILTQSLYFEYGSSQPLHQDTGYVVMNSPLRMAACWIALEDIEPGSGELAYYPESHRFPDWFFSRYFKHFDQERDGPDAQECWLSWIHEEAARRGIAMQRFLPKKGDVFVWHADLAHGGTPVENVGRTRRSLVGHFCPVGVRPLYAYYLPDRRRAYGESARRYMSSYYSA